jgi:hypothetical protein
MENFGDRLSVDDIWRVVMFLKTIPNGTLDPNVLPEPEDYIVWHPPDELLAWIKSRQPLEKNVSFGQAQSADPFIQEARRVFPGLAPGDRIVVNGLETPLTLQNAAAGIRLIYERLLDRAWSDARARGDKLPGPDQPLIPPTVPGQQ